MTRLSSHFLVAAAAASALALASAECTRDMLTGAAEAYVAAQTAGDPSAMPPSSESLAYSENFEDADISSGIISQALAIDYSRSTYDTTACKTYTEIIVTDPANQHVTGAQMTFDADTGELTLMEVIITSEGDWLFDPAGTLRYAEPEVWDVIPEEERDSREVLQAAADAYLDIFNDPDVEVPWGSPCARLEGGVYTGRGLPSDTCNIGVPCCLEMTNRRYVIDEALGAVGVFLTFAGNLPDSHEFRVEDSKLRYVHTLTVMGD